MGPRKLDNVEKSCSCVNCLTENIWGLKRKRNGVRLSNCSFVVDLLAQACAAGEERQAAKGQREIATLSPIRHHPASPRMSCLLNLSLGMPPAFVRAVAYYTIMLPHRLKTKRYRQLIVILFAS